MDVERGKQPLATPDNGLHLVGNGEVYNHEEILETLEDRDMTTRSDNEVALRLVPERGPDALAELLGMCAFLMADDDGGFIAARDPVGIKPLNWARRTSSSERAAKMPTGFLRYMEASVDHRALEAGSQTPYGRFGFVVHGVINFTPGKDVLPIKDHRLLQQDA